ncbi:MAG TPA: Flp pilus assembly protein CpaB [Baekduia sp.]|nr:Flp pilus assembly protein CpaB [Baekduia sp.]
MEAVVKRPLDGFRRFAGTRRGAFTLALVAAALAGVVLVGYLKNYKSSVQLGTTPTRVLIADRMIQKGTAGDEVVTGALFRPTTLAQDEVNEQALPDAAALAGKVATRDIFPGQQLVASDFSATGDSIRGRLSGADRAIGVSLEGAPGLIGTVHAGDKVDVMGIFAQQDGGNASAGVLRTLVQGALVLKAPSAASGGVGKGQADPILIRVDDRQAGQIAYAADNGHVWLALRPPAGARSSAPATIDLDAIGRSR